MPWIQTKAVSEQETVGHYVRELALEIRHVGDIVPLKALKQFCRLDHDALSQIFRSMKLFPITFCHEGSELVQNGFIVHTAMVSALRSSVTPHHPSFAKSTHLYPIISADSLA